MIPDGTANPSGEPKTGVKKHPVIELFGPVIQGEGSQAGQQTMFIRFGGCDYRCKQCDSLHAVLPGAVLKNATWMTPDEIIEKLALAKAETGVQWVTFSGGNPCMHKLDSLVEMLKSIGYFINVETQGTLWQDWLHYVDTLTVSPKSPGMGEKFEVDKFTKFLVKFNGVAPVCIKVVVFSPIDLEFALLVQEKAEFVAENSWLYGGRPYLSFYLSQGNAYPPRLNDEYEVEGGYDEVDMAKQLLSDYRILSEEVLQDPRLKAFRFLPQLHVLVYGNEAKR